MSCNESYSGSNNSFKLLNSISKYYFAHLIINELKFQKVHQGQYISQESSYWNKIETLQFFFLILNYMKASACLIYL